MTIDVIKENLRRITDSKYVVDLFLAVYGENRELERRCEMAQKEITRLKAEREMLRKLFELQNQELRKLENIASLYQTQQKFDIHDCPAFDDYNGWCCVDMGGEVVSCEDKYCSLKRWLGYTLTDSEVHFERGRAPGEEGTQLKEIFREAEKEIKGNKQGEE